MRDIKDYFGLIEKLTLAAASVFPTPDAPDLHAYINKVISVTASRSSGCAPSFNAVSTNISAAC